MAFDRRSHEDVITVTLARLLSGYGVQNSALVNFNGTPDIYVLVRGIRILIEIKEEGQRAALERQLGERIEKNLGEVGIGLLYPRSVGAGNLMPPTPLQVEKNLLKVTLDGFLILPSKGGKAAIIRNFELKVAQLPELLSRLSSEVIHEEDLTEAIDRVRSIISEFVSTVSSFENAKFVSQQFKEVLEGA